MFEVGEGPFFGEPSGHARNLRLAAASSTQPNRMMEPKLNIHAPNSAAPGV
ncbi:hypothetical protein [Streptomyces smaragdinus]|uniref:hypothetical protein n=1 Tax=Streptomyces smaragdinus TaxID=2585196 RepID=UPI0012978DA5|nr:hypothetical protein [Streptomyces smaragdinus]